MAGTIHQNWRAQRVQQPAAHRQRAPQGNWRGRPVQVVRGHGHAGQQAAVHGHGGQQAAVHGHGGQQAAVHGHGGQQAAVHGHGGQQAAVHGHGGQQAAVGGHAGPGNVPNGPAGNNGPGAGNGARGANTGRIYDDFGIQGRSGRNVSVKDSVVDSLERKFDEFRHLFLGHNQAKLDNAGLVVNGNTKVVINLKTNVVTIRDENDNVTNIALNNMPIPQGANRTNSVEYKMRQLAQQMRNELVNEGAMRSVDKCVLGQHYQGYQRHLLGNQRVVDGLSYTLRHSSSLTKDRMETAHGLNNYSAAERGAILGTSNNANYTQLVAARAHELQLEAENHAQEAINALRARLAAIPQARRTPAQEKQVVKLEAEIAMLGNNGMIELTCMVRARVEEDMKALPLIMTTGQRQAHRQQLAGGYLQGMKAYFESQRAHGQMGHETTHGRILTKKDKELATMIVATAVFAGATDDNGVETDDYKAGYTRFMIASGILQDRNLGKMGAIFSVMQVEETFQTLEVVNGTINDPQRFNLDHVHQQTVIDDHYQYLGLPRNAGTTGAAARQAQIGALQAAYQIGQSSRHGYIHRRINAI